MKQAPAVLVPFLMALTGCLSAPIPQELVDVDPPPVTEPLTMNEVSRLAKAGVSSEVIADLIRTHADLQPARRDRIVYRELVLPLWPSYARGEWRFGLRIGCYVRRPLEEQEFLRSEPELVPLSVDP